MISPSESSRSCDDPENSCATCICSKGSPGTASKLTRDEEGCKKPKTCPRYCPHWEVHRVGDEWDCWHEDYKYKNEFTVR